MRIAKILILSWLILTGLHTTELCAENSIDAQTGVTKADFLPTADSQAGENLGSSHNFDFDNNARVTNWTPGAFEWNGASSDVTAPSAISDLAASGGTNEGECNLSWTSPGDDAASGQASSYTVKYSTSAITAGNFAAATTASNAPSPSIAGTAESMVVTGLTKGTTYYFAIKTADEVPNTSTISNVVSAAATEFSSLITFASEAHASATSTTSLSFNVTLINAPHRLLVVSTAVEDYSDVPDEYVITSMVLGTKSLTKLDSKVEGTYNSCEQWYLLEEDIPTAGTYLLTINFAGTVSYCSASSTLFYSGAQITAESSVSASNTASANISTAITTVADNDMLVDVVQSGNARTDFTPGANQTQRSDFTNESQQMAVSSRLVGTAGEATNTWTIDGGAVNKLVHIVSAWKTYSDASDVTAPGKISNLSVVNSPNAGEVLLTWTAPGDDDTNGTVAAYDVRYSTANITAANWASASAASGEPAPVAAGGTSRLVISGLTPGTTYYFAIKSTDEVPNTSNLSDVVTIKTRAVDATYTCVGNFRIGSQ